MLFAFCLLTAILTQWIFCILTDIVIINA